MPGLDLPIIEWHAWRQTWTAYTALLFRDNGVDLLHPQVPVFGPPFEVPVEFPAVQALGAVVMRAGVAPDLAMRLVHLSLFFVSAALLYGLLRHVCGKTAAVAALVYFLFSPVNILFSRASLVEFGAVAGSLGFLWAGILWRERRSLRFAALALVAGGLAMLIKPSTGLVWWLPLVLWPVDRDADLRAWIRARLDPVLVTLCAAPLAIALVWTAWADSIKGAQEAASFHTSAGMAEFYFSNLAERLDPAIWSRDLLWLSLLVVGLGVVPVAAVGLWAGLASSRRLFWLGLLLSAVLPVAVFYGGYSKHDYYWTAITPQVAAFAGLGVAWLLARARTVGARATLGVALVGVAAMTLVPSADYWRLIYPPVHDPPGMLPRAAELAANSRPDDTVIVIGREFNSDLAYYARRKAVMLTAENWTEHLVSSLPAKPYRILFSWAPASDPIDILTRWAWTGVLSAHTYVVGASPTDLRSAALMMSDDIVAFSAAARSGRTLVQQPVRVPCDGLPHPIPAGPDGTWLRLRPDVATRISVDANLAPLIARTVVVLRPTPGAPVTEVRLACQGATELVIESVVSARPPD